MKCHRMEWNGLYNIVVAYMLWMFWSRKDIHLSTLVWATIYEFWSHTVPVQRKKSHKNKKNNYECFEHHDALSSVCFIVHIAIFVYNCNTSRSFDWKKTEISLNISANFQEIKPKIYSQLTLSSIKFDKSSEMSWHSQKQEKKSVSAAVASSQSSLQIIADFRSFLNDVKLVCALYIYVLVLKR